MTELFPELHGLLAREALRDEGDSLDAWQRLRLVNRAWHDGLQGKADPAIRSSLARSFRGSPERLASCCRCSELLQRRANVRPP